MGEASDDPDILDRIRFWTTKPSPGRTPDTNAGLPTTNSPTYDRAGHHLSTSEKDANPQAQVPGVAPPRYQGPQDGLHTRDLGGHAGTHIAHAHVPSATTSTAAASSTDTQDQGATDSSVKSKPRLSKERISAGIVRFGKHTLHALTHSWINVLLLFVPVAIAVEVTKQSPSVIFAINAVAIIPLAGLLVYATESVATRLGDTLGALLNVSFGNAVELIIYIIALTKGEIRIVQASLLGSILSNLLLIMGMAFTFGGLRYREQIYNSTVTQMSACLLSLTVISLLLPTGFHASFSDSVLADNATLKLSRATSIILLIIYILYLLFQLKSHAYLYESTPQHVIDEESHPGILADMLDSSSSSDSSDSSSSSDTDTSGSHTTTKRIKRAFRNRRRRKSSASSTNTTSVPSIISSPSFERNASFPDVSQTSIGGLPRRSTTPAMNHGYEADSEAQRRRGNGQPLIRDFVATLNEESIKDRSRKKKSKKHHKKHVKHRLDARVPEEDSFTGKQEKLPVNVDPPQSEPTENPEKAVDSGEGGQDSAPRKSLGFRQLQASTVESLRPNLPKMLTQNVFVSPSPSPGPANRTAPRAVHRTGAHVLRRTSSLPDRLRENPPPDRQVPIFPHAHPAAQLVVEREDRRDPEVMSRTASLVLLLVVTGLVAVCAEFLVGAIPGMIAASPISQEFVGLIILPCVSNAAEHFTAVTVAAKNKMDLAIGVSVGSSIQIALFITPFIVILGWIIGQPMTLYFNLFETLGIFVTVFVVNFLVLDGRSNYLEGSLLMAAYTIIAVAAFFYPDGQNQSTNVGGG